MARAVAKKQDRTKEPAKKAAPRAAIRSGPGQSSREAAEIEVILDRLDRDLPRLQQRVDDQLRKLRQSAIR
jgi:hypothetical protein